MVAIIRQIGVVVIAEVPSGNVRSTLAYSRRTDKRKTPDNAHRDSDEGVSQPSCVSPKVKCSFLQHHLDDPPARVTHIEYTVGEYIFIEIRAKLFITGRFGIG